VNKVERHMESAHSGDQLSATQPAPGRLPESFSTALRFWEPRRIVYNVVLAGFVVGWVVGSWPHFQPAFTLINAFQLAVLAVLANICYCAAYIAEMVMQPICAGANWLRWRSALWVVGTVLAVLFENYWIADEIYPFVR